LHYVFSLVFCFRLPLCLILPVSISFSAVFPPCFGYARYLGFAKDYKTLELHIPHKKPRKSKYNHSPSLSEPQKLENRVISQVRIVVEHVLASVKRWSILINKFRNRLDKFEDNVILAAAGLHNFLLNLQLYLLTLFRTKSIHPTVHVLFNAHSLQHSVNNRDVIHPFHYNWSTCFSSHT